MSFVAGCTIASPWNAHLSTEKLSHCPIFMKVLLNIFKNIHKSHFHEPHYRELLSEKNIDWDGVMNARDNLDIDREINMKDSNCEDLLEYHMLVSSHQNIKLVTVPLLCINSLDDLFVESEGIPIADISISENVIQVNVAGGGHIEFFSGFKAEKV